jgi:toxin ParE1/3/4
VKQKPVILRTRAELDIDEAIEYYVTEGGERPASAFLDDLEIAFAHIARHPATGSHRFAHELGITELQSWGLRHFPYIVFFVERADHIDAWRVLHGQRDIAGWMLVPTSKPRR